MIEQGSYEWRMLRVGKVTGSRIKDILAGGKGITRKRYAFQLAVERMTGKPSRLGFKSDAMERGTGLEQIARVEYEIRKCVDVDQLAFVNHPEIMMSGASPDGVIGNEGNLEIKCPDTHTHYGYLLSGVPPQEYIPQMAWQIECRKSKWCDFVSFDDEVPEEDMFFCVRYIPDEKYLQFLRDEVIKFNKEIEEMIDAIRGRRLLKAVAHGT